MNKALLGLWLLTAMTGSAAGQNNCLNLSGVYRIDDQSGLVQLTITQTGCTQNKIERRATSRGRTTTEQHTLKIDGQFQPDTPWMGTADKLETSAKFTSGALEVTARPATPKSAADFAWKRLFVVRSNGDLDIRDFSKLDDAYIPSATAIRQQ